MTTDEIKQKVIDYANGYGIDPGIALAQIGRESSFNPNAVGSSGERGLAQIMPGTWDRFAEGVPFDNAFDVDYNLTAWGNYLSYLLGLFNGDYTQALTAYNGGEGHLTDPGKYGLPSSAAQAYGQQLAAYASSYTAPASDQPANSLFGLPVWLLLGAAGVLLFVALKD